MSLQDIIAALAKLGREKEEELLRSAIEEVQKGQGKAILLSGDSDYGYNVIARQVMAKSGLNFYHTVCSAVSAPYSPLQVCFQNFFKYHQRSFDEFIRSLNDMSNPLFRGHLSRITRKLARSKDWVYFDLDPEAFFLSFSHALMDAKKPFVLLIEDVHWADSKTTQLIEFLLQNLMSEPILIILTVDLEAFDTPDLPLELMGKNLSIMEQLRAMQMNTGSDTRGYSPHKFIREIQSQGLIETVAFEALSLKEQIRILKKILGASACPDEFLYRLLDLTQGNGFYLGQVLLYLCENILEFRGKKWQLKYAPEDIDLPKHIEFIIQANLENLGLDTVVELQRASCFLHPIYIEDWWRSGSLTQADFDRVFMTCCKLGILETIQDDNCVIFSSKRQRKVLGEISQEKKREIHTEIARFYEEHKAPPYIQAHFWKSSEQPAKALDQLLAAGIEAEKFQAYPEAFSSYQEAARLFPEASEIFKAILEELCPTPVEGEEKKKEKLSKEEQLDKFLSLLRLYRIAHLANEEGPLLSGEIQKAWRGLVYQFSPQQVFPDLATLMLYLLQYTKKEDKSYPLNEVTFFAQLILQNLLPGRDYTSKIFFLEEIVAHPHLDKKNFFLQLVRCYEKWANRIGSDNKFSQACQTYLLAAWAAFRGEDHFHAARILHKLIKYTQKNKTQGREWFSYQVEALRRLAQVYQQAMEKEQEEEEKLKYAIQTTACYLDAARFQLEHVDASWLSIQIYKEAYKLCEEYYIDDSLAQEELESAQNKFELLEEEEYQARALIIADKKDSGAAETIFQSSLDENIFAEISFAPIPVKEEHRFVIILLHRDSPDFGEYSKCSLRLRALQENTEGWWIEEKEDRFYFVLWGMNPAELYSTALRFDHEKILRSYI